MAKRPGSSAATVRLMTVCFHTKAFYTRTRAKVRTWVCHTIREGGGAGIGMRRFFPGEYQVRYTNNHAVVVINE